MRNFFRRRRKRKQKKKRKKSKVPVLATKNGTLYVPYMAAVFSRERLTKIAEEVIREAHRRHREEGYELRNFKRVVVVVGVSASGKSYLVSELKRLFSDTFNITKQYTTREQRDETDNMYEFIDHEEFNRISHKLIGITEFNSNSYGSEIDFTTQDEIDLIVLDRQGWDDYLERVEEVADNQNIFDIRTMVIRLDVRNLNELVKLRPDRSIEFLQNERDLLFNNDNEVHLDITVDHKTNHYADVGEVINEIHNHFINVNKEMAN